LEIRQVVRETTRRTQDAIFRGIPEIVSNAAIIIGDAAAERGRGTGQVVLVRNLG